MRRVASCGIELLMSATALDQRAIEYLGAANAGADVRTVRKILAGKRAKGDVDTRVRRVLLAMGITPPAPQTEAKSP